MDWDKVRQWQVQVVVQHADTIPIVPDMIVEEKENTRLYRLDGLYRKNEAGGQISVTIGGRGILKAGDEKIPLVPGKAFIHKHSDPAVSYYYPQDGVEPWHFIWVSLLGANVNEIIDSTVARYGYVYDVPPDSELVKKLFSFRCESKQMHFMQPFEAAEQAFALLRMLCEKAECKRSRHGELISRVQMYIASRFNKPLSAGEIAGVFRVSREHLSRIFKDETGESIHEYITGIRMKAALSLLRETRLTIKEISQQCGYSQYSVFYKTFTAFFKCKPQEKRPDRRFFTDSELP